MNNFLQNKQNLLFIGQSIVVLGVSFYFYKRLQAVIFNINELHKIVINQQEQINKQNLIIESLKTAFTSNFPRNNESTRVTITPPKIDEKVESSVTQPIQLPQPSKIVLPDNKTKSRLFSGINSTLIFRNKDSEEKKTAQIEIVEEKNEEDNDENEEQEEDEDLDAELQNELRELESERNLKRR
jgi:hypothetical protein